MTIVILLTVFLGLAYFRAGVRLCRALCGLH